MDNKALAQQLVQRCLKKGADAAEVYVESNRELSLEVRNGEIETVQEAASAGAGIRVLIGGRLAFASVNDLREATLEDAIGRAVGFAKITTADPDHVLPEDPTTVEVAGLYDPDIAVTPLDRKIELIKAVEIAAMKDARITKSAGSAYGEGESEVFIANSTGLLKTSRASGCSFGVSVVAEKGEQKSSGGEYCGRRFFADLKTPEEVAEKAARKAYETLDPKKVKTQKAAVIFDCDVAGTLLAGILSAVNGERVLQGASFLGPKLNQKIASDLLTVTDDGLRPKGPASAPFDGEGVTTQTRVIVEAGVLKGFLYNTIIGKKAGVKSTGNASRGGFASLPGIGPHNFVMSPGQAKPEDIVKATKSGLLLKEVTGYGINPVNGQFSGGASGFWIENGKIAFPVIGLTIAGSAEEMFNGIDMVADDVDLNRGLAAPTFRIKLMQIGGE
jgi:PmbA protein